MIVKQQAGLLFSSERGIFLFQSKLKVVDYIENFHNQEIV